MNTTVATSTTGAEQAAVLALTRASPGEWFRTAAVIYESGGALALLDRQIGLIPEEHRQYAEELLERVRPEDLDAAEELVARVTAQGVRLLTVREDDYPANLQLVYNRPPFIWVKGDLAPGDFRAVAVVGTRQASEDGRRRATRLTRGLTEANVTVLSGLARGIDTSAHTAALEANGRTLAVVGHGILTAVYPQENRELAERICKQGALVSQFWPDAPPQATNFPMRNVVMSGMAMGTVVIEASATGGSKMQARLALEHGKRLFLLESLVKSQDWAQRYAERPGVTVVRELDDVLEVIATLSSFPEQLVLL
ncbi:MAG: DNA-protecting protein DprA [Pseudonocardiales bacterium]|nr:DNA-protecting protein DprA [Pseudonocardiales bacterium]